MEEIKKEYAQELELKTEGLLKLSKSEIADKVKNAIQLVKNGEADKIDAYIYAKKGLELFTSLSKGLKPLADGVTLNKGYTRFNTAFEEKMQGVSFDFSECGDLLYNDMVQRQAELTLEISQREDFLKSIVKPMELLDTDTGETYTVQPPIKKGKLGYTVKIS